MRGGWEGVVGNQEYQESVRRLLRETCDDDVVVRRPEGVGRGVAAPHEVGTDTRNVDRKIDAESR
jgi:hypothetical protein